MKIKHVLAFFIVGTICFINACALPKDYTGSVSYTEIQCSPFVSNEKQTKGTTTIFVEPYLSENPLVKKNYYKYIGFTGLVRLINTEPKTTDSPQFKIRIKNDSDQILFLKESVLQFRLGNATVAVNKSKYQAFNNGIVPPKQEEELFIEGPNINNITNGQLLNICLFGIPTEYDKAGVPTKKENFEWVYKINKVTKTIQATATFQEISYYESDEERKSFINAGGYKEFIEYPAFDKHSVIQTNTAK